MDNPTKAKVAKLWTAAILTDLGFEVETTPRAAWIQATRRGHRLIIRSKACYSDQGVPFRGFRINDSDFVVFVDLRKGAPHAEAWVVPTEVVFTELERAYREMKREHLLNRTLYWGDGRRPHYGFEQKFRAYRNAWELLTRQMVCSVATRPMEISPKLPSGGANA